VNLLELVELQKKLDSHIEKEHPRKEGEDRFFKKRMALLVEIGEAANEARFFKYWSVTQRPKKRIQLLDELADILHFILSVGIEIGYDFKSIKLLFPAVITYEESELIEEFEYLYYYTLKISEDDYFVELLSTFIVICAMFGFTREDVTKAYKEKNETNHKRQVNRY
jgi:dimeric dUTPase (all-alpha-NTP-PPase superfamily)